MKTLTPLSFILLLVLLFMPRGAQAQEQRLETTITYLAGPNLYLDLGTDAGIAAGDTLRVFRDDALVGQWRVISSSGKRSVVVFVTDPFPVEVGDAFVVAFVAPPQDEPPQPEPNPPPVQERPSILEEPTPTVGPRQQIRPPVQVNGRVSFDVNTLRSTTRFLSNTASERTRSFTTPTLGVRATVSQLPGGMTFNVNLRASQRFSTGDLIQPAGSMRLYEASLAKPVGRLTIKGGRFYNSAERFSGYWDGLMVMHRPRTGLGGGVALGFEPDRANEGFSTDLPKAMAFLTYRYRRDDFRYDGGLSVHHVQPQNGYLEHTFLGASSQFRWQGFRFRQEVQLDRNPVTAAWVASRLQLRLTVPLGERLRATGRYTIRQPYLLTRTQNPIAFRRDQYQAGLVYGFTGGSVGITLTQNTYQRGPSNTTYAAFFNLTKTPLLGLGFNGNMSYWQREGQNTRYAGLGVSRAFGPVRAQVRYTHYTSQGQLPTLTTHAVLGTLSFPLMGRLHGSLQGRLQRGQNLNNVSFYTGLWMRL